MDKNTLITTVTAAAQGDQQAFEALYAQYHDQVYFFALKNLSDPQAAQDVTQETFLRSMEKLSELRDPAAYVGWLHSIAYHKCLDLLNDRQRSTYFTTDRELESALESTRLNEPLMLPQDYAESAQVRDLVKKAIDSLKPDQRAAVILYYYDDLPVAQVAKTLGVSENSAALKLRRARKKLEQKLRSLTEGGALCAVPLSGLFRSSLDSSAAAALRTTAAPAAAISGKVLGIASAAVIAVGVPVALAYGTRGGGGARDLESSAYSAPVEQSEQSDPHEGTNDTPVISDSDSDETDIPTSDDQDTHITTVELVRYTEPASFLVITQNYGLCTLSVPQEDMDRILEHHKILISGQRFKVKWSGDLLEIYPSVMDGIESVEFEENGEYNFVEPHLDALLQLAYTKSDDQTLEDLILDYMLSNQIYPNFSSGEVEALSYLIENELMNSPTPPPVEETTDESTPQDLSGEPLAETFASQAEQSANVLSELYGIRFDTGMARWVKPEGFDITDTEARDSEFDLDEIQHMDVPTLLKYTLWYFQYNTSDERARANADEEIILALDQRSSGEYYVTYVKFGDQIYDPTRTDNVGKIPYDDVPAN